MLKLETETFGLPPNGNSPINARPKVGDHVTAAGRWIFDCGHPPKTEIHPIAFLATDREELRPLWPGGPIKRVKSIRVWMNSDPRPFTFRFDGPFRFAVEMPRGWPPLNWMPFVRVLEGDPALVTWTPKSPSVYFTVEPPAETGSFYFEMILGRLEQPDDGESLAADLFTLSFDSIEVFDDHDAGDPGEWFVAINANGIWRQLFWDAAVSDDDPPVSLTNVPPISLAARDLTLQFTGYEDDGVFNPPRQGGEALVPDPDTTDPRVNGIYLGLLRNLLGAQTFAPDGAEYILHYTVTQGGSVSSILVDSNFWAPLLAGEPNDQRPLNLGALPVPPEGAPPAETSHAAWLTERGERIVLPDGTNMELLESDLDQYEFGLEDFGDVTIGPMPPDIMATLERWDPTHAGGSVPSRVRVLEPNGQIVERDTLSAVGYRGGRVRVFSESGAIGRRNYLLGIRTTYRALPPDWGENLDAQFEQNGTGGRLADLVSVPPNPGADPRLQINAPSFWHPEQRHLDLDWAWQHVRGDADYYVVRFPGFDPSPPGHDPCLYDQVGKLTVRAAGMQLAIPELDRSGSGLILLADAATLFPWGGQITVVVTHPNPERRGFYQLSATWENTRFYTATECAELREHERIVRSFFPGRQEELLKGVIALSGMGGLGPRFPLPDPEIYEISDRGIYLPVFLRGGNGIDLTIAGQPGRAVRARLYDSHGLLLGESAALSQFTSGQIAAVGGQVAQQRLRVEGLGSPPLRTAGAASSLLEGIYFLQLVPEAELGAEVTEPFALSFTEVDLDQEPGRPVLGLPVLRADGVLEFLLEGAIGERYRVEGSTDLRVWQEIATFLNYRGTTKIEDPLAPFFPRQFYRAVVAPTLSR
jgi:hypothetical protein